MTTTLLPLPREDVVAALGNALPIPATAPVLRVNPAAGVTDGAVIISLDPTRPGALWWLIDGVVPPQAAGPVDEGLADLIPGSVLEVPPPPDREPEPPYTIH